jgi:hypothetical protein
MSLQHHDEAGFVSSDLLAEALPLTLSGDDGAREEQPNGCPLDSAPWMSDFHNDLPSATVNPMSTSDLKSKLSSASSTDSVNPPLDASEDTRQIVRLVQCSQCSYLLRDPMTLPCGNSLCRKCIPELHVRPNISYPATENRLRGFTCPFTECKQEHAVGDCSLDVTLAKVIDLVKRDIEVYKPVVHETPMRLEERDKWAIAGVSSLSGRPPRSRVLQGGRLVATYIMVDMGELDFDSELVYTTMSETGDDYRYLDVAVLEHLKEATRSELDCQVCYALFLDPLTTCCGHTFCRKCLHRVLDHSNCCPICRRTLSIPPSLTKAQYPSNKRLDSLLFGLCPDAIIARAEAVRQEGNHRMGDLDTPLFICTLSFPSMPTFLHIFEPRYRLMIRRAMESGDRKFGMLLHNPSLSSQGELGPVPFYQYGTLLHIISMQLLPDGRSLIETTGASRFRVLKYGTLDGYTVGQIQRIHDISLADEENLEASETSQSSPPHSLSAADHFGAPPHHPRPRRQPRALDLDTTSTKDLMEIATRFVRSMQAQSAPWLQTRVLQVYGEFPNDPALFPWWFASILPIMDAEKYKLLETTSVRQRLKICVGWILRIEAQRW